MTTPPAKQFPKDGQIISQMIREFGITSHEPRVVTQFMEIAMRYISCVLDDARSFANHVQKKSIDTDDIKLAVTMQQEKTFSSPLPRDLVLEIARSKNATALPIVKTHCGIHLPPDRYCFSSANYKMKLNKKSDLKTKFQITGSGLKKSSGGMQGIRLGNITTVARTQPATNVKSVMKTTSAVINQTPMVAKAKIQIGNPLMQQTQMETESTDGGLKRKREEDDEQN